MHRSKYGFAGVVPDQDEAVLGQRLPADADGGGEPAVGAVGVRHELDLEEEEEVRNRRVGLQD